MFSLLMQPDNKCRRTTGPDGSQFFSPVMQQSGGNVPGGSPFPQQVGSPFPQQVGSSTIPPGQILQQGGGLQRNLTYPATSFSSSSVLSPSSIATSMAAGSFGSSAGGGFPAPPVRNVTDVLMSRQRELQQQKQTGSLTFESQQRGTMDTSSQSSFLFAASSSSSSSSSSSYRSSASFASPEKSYLPPAAADARHNSSFHESQQCSICRKIANPRTISIGRCGHCEKLSCSRCSNTCARCDGSFCRMCTTTSYLGRYEETYCPACIAQIQDEIRAGQSMGMMGMAVDEL